MWLRLSQITSGKSPKPMTAGDTTPVHQGVTRLRAQSCLMFCSISRTNTWATTDLIDKYRMYAKTCEQGQGQMPTIQLSICYAPESRPATFSHAHSWGLGCDHHVLPSATVLASLHRHLSTSWSIQDTDSPRVWK